MKYQALLKCAAFKRTLVSVALAAAYSSSWALPAFTFKPFDVGLAGTAVTADNILLSDFSTVRSVGSTGFTENGFLSVTGFQSGGSNVIALGLNSTYSLYFAFTGSGHLTTGTSATDPRTSLTGGVFDTLNFSFLGANGNSTFGFSGNDPTVNNTGTPVVLATGSLINGNISTSPANGDTAFVPSANASVTFAQTAGKEGFFSPQPFYNMAFTAFTNSVSTVQPFDGGFRINNGGGNLNFAVAAPVPEPETYALMMAGLGVMGFVARRRKNAKPAA